MGYKVEREWITKAGLKAVCLFVNDSYRCGYVCVKKGHPLYGKKYNDDLAELKYAHMSAMSGPVGKRSPISIFTAIGCERRMDVVFDVHGGVTYSGKGHDYPIPGQGWWIGFDCAHAGDGTLGSYASCDGPVRDVDYVISECEELATQVAQVTYKPLFAIKLYTDGYIMLFGKYLRWTRRYDMSPLDKYRRRRGERFIVLFKKIELSIT